MYISYETLYANLDALTPGSGSPKNIIGGRSMKTTSRQQCSIDGT